MTPSPGAVLDSQPYSKSVPGFRHLCRNSDGRVERLDFGAFPDSLDFVMIGLPSFLFRSPGITHLRQSPLHCGKSVCSAICRTLKTELIFRDQTRRTAGYGWSFGNGWIIEKGPVNKTGALPH